MSVAGPVRALVWLALATAVAIASACENAEPPTRPSAAKPQYVPLDVRCTADAALRCTVQRFGEGDLTARAEWFATDVMWVGGVDARVRFPAPGVPQASEPVTAYIAARVGGDTRASLFSFEMAPGARPVPHATFSGYVFDGDTGFVGVSGVAIRLEGDGIAPQTATTDVNGRYAFTHVRVGVPLTIAASRDGFAPQTARVDGIRPTPDGNSPEVSSAVQHFRLVRRP